MLLESGGDPFAEAAIEFLVLDGTHEKPDSRLEILQAIIDAGVDISVDLGDEKGCNLHALAVDCNDRAVIDLLENRGFGSASRTPVESDVPELNLETLQKRLVRALKKGWTEVKRNRKGETFYVFGIVTDSDCQTMIPVCNTEELAVEEFGELLDENPLHKYHLPSVRRLYGAGEEYFPELIREISHQDFRLRVKTKLMKIFEGALAELDEKRFFGSGKNRNKIILMISNSDPNEREEKLEERIIRRLNPKEAYLKYLDR